jgi:hypothetical protein
MHKRGIFKLNITFNTAITVALLTAMISFIVQYFFKYYDNRNHSQSIKKAIISEIAATLKIIEKRNYREWLQSCVDDLESGKSKLVLGSIEQQQNLFPVYKANIDKIGVLNANLASNIVMFYALLESVLIDTKSDGLLNNPEFSSLDAFIETLKILDDAILLGKEIENT